MAAHVFADGEMATKANLDSLLPGRVTRVGTVTITPVANTPTSVRVTFPAPFASAPQVALSPATGYIGLQVKGVAVTDVTTTGFTAWVYRTTTAKVTILWQAWGVPATFTDGGYAYASTLNQSVGAMVAKVGTVSITPVANTPTYASVTFASPFAATPAVVACPVTVAPQTEVRGAAVTEVTRSGFKAWVYRTNTIATTVSWIAMGRP